MARHKRKQKLPQDPLFAPIESLSHDGRGIARVEGKTVFVEGALAGEQVEFLYTRLHKNYDEARTLSVVEPALDRVVPRCAHFGSCGGCSLMHMTADAQLQHKQATLAEQLAHFGQLQPEQWLAPLSGPLWGYRYKARLAVKYVAKKQKVLVGFREKASSLVAELQRCPVLDPRVGERLAELGGIIERMAARDRIAQIEVAMDDSHTALVFRNLQPLSANDQQILIDYGQAHDLWIYLQAAGPDTITPLWPANPQLHYSPEPGLELRFGPADFTQVNTKINEKMIQHAIELLDIQPDDRILDLFCGLGNFSLPLARRAAEVVGVEGDAALVGLARNNAVLNHLSNATFELADLTKMVLKAHPWASAGFNKILLDPPRSGAFEVLHQLVELGAERLVYISCNPATLARDAGELVNKYGYKMVAAGVMDMFPHTSHVESVALFIKDKHTATSAIH